MAFIDMYRFEARAGKGGDGVVRWRREKYIPRGGPNGGDGGRGADFYLRGVRDINRLSKLARTTSYHAEDGEAGGSSSCTGKGGERYVLELPIGSVVTNEDNGAMLELLEDEQELCLLRGGEGGLGNEHFKSASNQTPMEATKGKPGEQGRFRVELRIIADVGLVGLPNAGKTSLLNALTNAGAKVGDYPFTTLDPNLGVYFGLVLADIPGLIEGASEGKGLGHAFLRHVSRTRVLVHCISSERDTAIDEYKTVSHELEHFEGISDKRELVVFTKTDMCDADEVATRVRLFEKETGVRVFKTVTVLDDQILKEFGDSLVHTVAEMHLQSPGISV